MTGKNDLMKSFLKHKSDQRSSDQMGRPVRLLSCCDKQCVTNSTGSDMHCWQGQGCRLLPPSSLNCSPHRTAHWSTHTSHQQYFFVSLLKHDTPKPGITHCRLYKTTRAWSRVDHHSPHFFLSAYFFLTLSVLVSYPAWLTIIFPHNSINWMWLMSERFYIVGNDIVSYEEDQQRAGKFC